MDPNGYQRLFDKSGEGWWVQIMIRLMIHWPQILDGGTKELWNYSW